MTCTDAQKAAIAAVRRMNYTVETVTKPAPGTPGIVTAAREELGKRQGLVVQVFCTALGAEVEAKSDQGGLAQLTFPEEFRQSFEAAAKAQPPPRPAAESGLDVLLTPERSGSGIDVGTGLLPVSVRITNHTPRAYHFSADDVVLYAQSGDRVAPVSNRDLATQLDAARLEALRAKLVSDRDVGPNETLVGYLVFPFQTYVRARVVLTDRVSDEPEGFSIEF